MSLLPTLHALQRCVAADANVTLMGWRAGVEFEMKRDMDLVKAILLKLENTDCIGFIDDYSAPQVNYHVALLQDAGLIVNDGYYDATSPAMQFRTRMTWSGHEFLDASRNNSLWERAKKITLEKTGALTFEVLKAVLAQLAKEAVGLTP